MQSMAIAIKKSNKSGEEEGGEEKKGTGTAALDKIGGAASLIQQFHLKDESQTNTRGGGRASGWTVSSQFRPQKTIEL